MAITKKNLAIKRKKLAALISKGRTDYPDVEQIRSEWIKFDLVDNRTPVAACAVGFAMLGKWDGKIKPGNMGDYQERIDRLFSYKTPYSDAAPYDDNVTEEVMQMNDAQLLDLDEIIAKLENDGYQENTSQAQETG